MKTCGKCKEKKELSEFSKDKSKKDGLQGRCQPCVSQDNRTRSNKKLEWAINERGGACEGCGLTHKNIRFFEWHHEDPSEKEDHISTLAICGWKKFKEEFEKCLVLCPNCHKDAHLQPGMAKHEIAGKKSYV